MGHTITFAGPTRAVAALCNAFEFGVSAERPGVIDTVHAATWRMAGLIEQLHALHADQAKQLQRRAFEG
ncbi:hypothetical protein [Streptomyces sp. adm13(2018)]|uniref:hypothetical protein n=1 Tax=Streptomyces sp. adm13(2018) TaxID=2479007 RepID=UPI0011CE1614|nr:hypothetical protein [Streptomyces sp. adm13(2018)]